MTSSIMRIQLILAIGTSKLTARHITVEGSHSWVMFLSMALQVSDTAEGVAACWACESSVVVGTVPGGLS